MERLDFLDIAKGEPGAAQAPLIAYFNETFRTRTSAEWEAFLSKIDLCWAPLHTLKDGFNDAHTLARGMVLTDEAGNRHIGPAIKFEATPAQPDLTTPRYDQTGKTTWRD